MTKLLPYLFGAIALIHAAPSVALFMPSRLSSLYGFQAGDPVMTTLLQHRALLFGILAAALIYAIFRADVRVPALIGASVSMAGFMLIALMRGASSGALRPIVIADIIGLILAALAAFVLLKG